MLNAEDQQWKGQWGQVQGLIKEEATAGVGLHTMQEKREISIEC